LLINPKNKSLFKTKKGQLNSIDLLMASIIFSLLIVFLVGFWVVDINDIYKISKKSELESQAISISDLLLKSRGIPKNWEENLSNVSMIGLVNSQNVFVKSKLNNFTHMNYTKAKELLGIKNEFYFCVNSLNGNTLYQSGNSTLGENGSIGITRFAVLDSEEVIVRLIIHG